MLQHSKNATFSTDETLATYETLEKATPNICNVHMKILQHVQTTDATFLDNVCNILRISNQHHNIRTSHTATC
jgi:hypothetical protein